MDGGMREGSLLPKTVLGRRKGGVAAILKPDEDISKLTRRVHLTCRTLADRFLYLFRGSRLNHPSFKGSQRNFYASAC